MPVSTARVDPGQDFPTRDRGESRLPAPGRKRYVGGNLPWMDADDRSALMIRVFLLDDHALVRCGYRMILQHEVDIEVVGEAATGEEGLPLIRRLQPQVVVCDLHLPGMSGLEITERLVKGQADCKVVIVTVQEDGPVPKRLIEAGAS